MNISGWSRWWGIEWRMCLSLRVRLWLRLLGLRGPMHIVEWIYVAKCGIFFFLCLVVECCRVVSVVNLQSVYVPEERYVLDKVGAAYWTARIVMELVATLVTVFQLRGHDGRTNFVRVQGLQRADNPLVLFNNLCRCLCCWIVAAMSSQTLPLPRSLDLSFWRLPSTIGN